VRVILIVWTQNNSPQAVGQLIPEMEIVISLGKMERKRRA
jgi:hypothetical protein